MRRGWWVVAGVWLGCSEKAAPDAGSPAELQAIATARCAEHVSSELRAALLPGWEELPVPDLERSGLHVCLFKKTGTQSRLTVVFDCADRPSEGQLSRMKDALLERGGTEVPDLGRAAVRAKVTEGLEQISAWDQDTACGITTTWFGDGREQTAELTRQLLDGLRETPGDAGVVAAPDAGAGG